MAYCVNQEAVFFSTGYWHFTLRTFGNYSRLCKRGNGFPKGYWHFTFVTSLILVRAGKDQIPPYSVISMSRIAGGKHLYGGGEGDSYAKAGIAGVPRENLGIKFHSFSAKYLLYSHFPSRKFCY